MSSKRAPATPAMGSANMPPVQPATVGCDFFAVVLPASGRYRNAAQASHAQGNWRLLESCAGGGIAFPRRGHCPQVTAFPYAAGVIDSLQACKCGDGGNPPTCPPPTPDRRAPRTAPWHDCWNCKAAHPPSPKTPLPPRARRAARRHRKTARHGDRNAASSARLARFTATVILAEVCQIVNL